MDYKVSSYEHYQKQQQCELWTLYYGHIKGTSVFCTINYTCYSKGLPPQEVKSIEIADKPVLVHIDNNINM